MINFIKTISNFTLQSLLKILFFKVLNLKLYATIKLREKKENIFINFYNLIVHDKIKLERKIGGVNMSMNLIKIYFEWFYEKICSGEKFSVLFQILYCGIMEYFEINEIEIEDDSYIISEIIEIIYKISCGEKVTYRYFCLILTRLKYNIIKKQNKFTKFISYNDEKLYKNNI